MNFLKILKGVGTPDEGTEGTGYMVKSLCPTCLHFNHETITCHAFPKAIPIGILMGVIDHTKPYEHEGVTDHGIQYEPIDEYDTGQDIFDKLQ